MINKLFGSKKESGNTRAKKAKGGFSLEIEEDSQDTTPVAESVTPVKVEAETKGRGKAKAKAKAEATPTSNADTPDWVQLISKQNGQNTSATPAEDNTTFADKYLLTISSRGRRRPGKSMSQYMDMASQMKT